MTDPQLTRIVAVVDRTGSMSRIRADVEERFAAFMAAQRDSQAEVGDRVAVDLYTFDRQRFLSPDRALTEPAGAILETVYTGVPIADVPPLAIQPRGETPLNDAVAFTIDRVGAELAALPERERPGQVIVVIVTDGIENSSLEYIGVAGADRVREKVDHQRTHYGWHFEFIGIGIDAWAAGGAIGMTKKTTYQSDLTGAGIAAVYGASAQSVVSHRAKAQKGHRGSDTA